MEMPAEVRAVREEWIEDGVICHFCFEPTFAWLTTDHIWAKVEPLLGQNQACFQCFAAAWYALGNDNGEPFLVLEGIAQ